VATTAPPVMGILFRVFASKRRIVSLTRELGLPLLFALLLPLVSVGAIGGLAPGDLALEALDDCSFAFPLDRPLDLEDDPKFNALDLVGLGLIPVVKLLFNLASNFFGSEIGLGILDLVMDVRRTKVLPEAPAAPLPASPAVVRSQK